MAIVESLIDRYLWFVHLDRRMPLNLDLGPLHIHLYSRAVFFMWVTAALLALAGIAVLISRKPELVQKWRTWVLIAPSSAFPCGSAKAPPPRWPPYWPSSP